MLGLLGSLRSTIAAQKVEHEGLQKRIAAMEAERETEVRLAKAIVANQTARHSRHRDRGHESRAQDRGALSSALGS